MSVNIAFVTPPDLDEEGWVDVEHDFKTHDVDVTVRNLDTWETLPSTVFHYKTSVKVRIGYMDLTSAGTLEWRPASWNRARVVIVPR